MRWSDFGSLTAVADPPRHHPFSVRMPPGDSPAVDSRLGEASKRSEGVKVSLILSVAMLALGCSASSGESSPLSTGDEDVTAGADAAPGVDSEADTASTSEADIAAEDKEPLAPPPPGKGFQLTLEGEAAAGSEVWICDVYELPEEIFANGFANVSWVEVEQNVGCLLYTSPSPRDLSTSRMPSSA